MRILTMVAAGLLAVSTQVAAAQDAIATRQLLMDSNGGAGAVAGGILKGEIAYDATVARAALLAFHATSVAYGDYFPEGSEDPVRSKAAPAIWTDRAGFDAELAKFRDRAAAAVEAAGREGPADVAAFQAAVGPIFDSCKTCHETYQLRN